MPTLELHQDELDLLLDAVATRIDSINAEMDQATADGDRVKVTVLSEQAQRFNALHARLSPGA